MKTRQMKVLCLLLVALALAVRAAGQTVCSPDGRLTVAIDVADGVPMYSLLYDGHVFLEPSPLGLATTVGDFTRDMTLAAAAPVESISDDYSVASIKQSRVHYAATRGVFTFAHGDRAAYDVVFQVSDRDVAFRYQLYPQGDSLCCVVLAEATGFQLPVGSLSYACPQARPMEGWRRTSPSYETPYSIEPVGANGWGEGYTFPCLFRTPAGWLLLSETGVTSAYCGGRLIGHDGGLYTLAFPQEGEMNGNGNACPGLPLPCATPWRTITVGTTLAPIVETTVPFDVVAPQYAPSQEYVYGAGVWSWIMGMDGSVNYADQQRYIDFCAAMGWQTVLVDNYWDTQIGREGIEQLAAYARSKGVALFLWYNSNGYWNDSPQSPRNLMDNIIARRREMRWLQTIGVRGIKVDFMGSDKQKAMQLFEEILADANDYGLMVIFHGCTIPRGWERMYPNYVTSEAVLASENLYFAQSFCDNEALAATFLPFIRNTVGAMDFGGSALNKYYNKENSPAVAGSMRRTSDVFALATAVLFQSAVQHFAVAPNNLTDAPQWALTFLQTVPTTWDEVRYLAGEPGRYVVLARRKGSDWYVAGVNGEQQTLSLCLPLPMFAAGETVTVYSDDAQLVGSVEQVAVDADGALTVLLPCNGAVVITTRE